MARVKKKEQAQMKKKERLPDMSDWSPDQIHEFWATRSTVDYLDEMEEVDIQVERRPLRAVGVKLTEKDIDTLKAIASKEGIGYSTLIRMWIKEKLHERQRASLARSISLEEPETSTMAPLTTLWNTVKENLGAVALSEKELFDKEFFDTVLEAQTEFLKVVAEVAVVVLNSAFEGVRQQLDKLGPEELKKPDELLVPTFKLSSEPVEIKVEAKSAE
ncbi:MAG: CopG family antitoxin [Candidatus Bipolaricaulia bacterium]